MKKLIAVLVVFAIVSGAAFAQFSGNMINSIDLAKGSTNDGDDDIIGGGEQNRWRIEGAGENEEGTFGAWSRLDGVHWSGNIQFESIVWWKPIDQLKVSIGGNSDGIFGKEGYAGWMYFQIVNETNVVEANQAWGCAYSQGLVFRDAFFGGYGGQGLLLEITPMDMVAINLAVPFIDMAGAKTKDIIKYSIAQVDLNLDFGNIAITYVGGDNKLVMGDIMDPDWDGPDVFDASKIYLYFGLGMVENLDLGVSVGYTFPVKDDKITFNSPIAAGVGAKYSFSDEFALKARAVASFAGNIDYDGTKADFPLQLIFEVHPSYNITETVTIFADVGVNFTAETKFDGTKVLDSVMGWHFNPYIGIGSEWGPRFFGGLKVYSTGEKNAKDDTWVNWAVPIGMVISF